jgi:uncharacterized ferritin-like protein (DUF455 family)
MISTAAVEIFKVRSLLLSTGRLLLFVLQPPFNEPARAKAGFGPEWYLPLVARVDK